MTIVAFFSACRVMDVNLKAVLFLSQVKGSDNCAAVILQTKCTHSLTVYCQGYGGTR